MMCCYMQPPLPGLLLRRQTLTSVSIVREKVQCHRSSPLKHGELVRDLASAAAVPGKREEGLIETLLLFFFSCEVFDKQTLSKDAQKKMSLIVFLDLKRFPRFSLKMTCESLSGNLCASLSLISHCLLPRCHFLVLSCFLFPEKSLDLN